MLLGNYGGFDIFDNASTETRPWKPITLSATTITQSIWVYIEIYLQRVVNIVGGKLEAGIWAEKEINFFSGWQRAIFHLYILINTCLSDLKVRNCTVLYKITYFTNKYFLKMVKLATTTVSTKITTPIP